MTNSKTTKKALVLSLLSLLLCCSMLVGTTFAWFTDSVTTGNNKIVAGNLDVELEYLVNGTWTKVTETTNVFEENTLWEPGHTEVVYLKVSNLGTLALDYKLGVNIAYELTSINVAGEELQLSKYLQVGVIEDVTTAYATRELARAAVTSTTPLTDGYAKAGTLYPANNVPADGKTEQYVALVVYMPEETGNEANYKTGYEAPEITLGINLMATQETYEKDSFNELYDDEADELINAFGSAPVNPTGATYIEVKKPDGTKIATVTVPADAVDGDPEKIEVKIVETALYNGITVADDQEATTFDVTVTGLKEGNTTPVKVELYVGEDLNVQGLYHYGEPVEVYTYNAGSGYVIFESVTFSPFTVMISTTPAVPETPNFPEGMPVATVTDADQYENTPITWGSYGGFTPSNPDQQLESAYIFTAPHTSENIDECAYANWYCDYVVSMDRDVADGALFLGGNYGSFGWVGFENIGVSVPANTEIPLLGSVTSNPWTYEDIASFVGTFTCGVAHLDESLDGATFTVKLRLTNPEDANEYYDVNTVSYTFNRPTDLPVAEVEDADQYEGTEIAWGSYGQWSPSDSKQQLESAYTFTAVDTAETVATNPYKDWYCDYYVSMDQEVPEGTLFLGGNYGSFGWVGFENPISVSANEEVSLLGSVTTNPWTYEQVVKSVGTFICGVADVDDALKGATFTVHLRLTNPEDDTEFYNISTITYTFE